MLCLTDARTNYLYNVYIYDGKDTDGIGLTPDKQTLGKATPGNFLFKGLPNVLGETLWH